MFGRVASVARPLSSGVARTLAVRNASSAFCRRTTPLAAVARLPFQKRYSQVEVFGPFDPPQQLTFKQVEDRVLKAIRGWDRFPADKESLLKIDATFARDLGFDSLDHVEIMMAIEDEFGFEIPIAEAEKLKSPKDVYKYICEREDVFE